MVFDLRFITFTMLLSPLCTLYSQYARIQLTASTCPINHSTRWNTSEHHDMTFVRVGSIVCDGDGITDSRAPNGPSSIDHCKSIVSVRIQAEEKSLLWCYGWICGVWVCVRSARIWRDHCGIRGKLTYLSKSGRNEVGGHQKQTFYAASHRSPPFLISIRLRRIT